MIKLLKIVSFLIFIQIYACSSSPTSKAKDDDVLEIPKFEWLSTQANKIVDSLGNQILLYGVNRSGLEYNISGNDMSLEEYQFICNDWQAKIIRLPFNQDWYTSDPNYVATLNEVVSWIKSCGAYVLLDLQWEDTDVKIPPIPNEAAIQMWQDIANSYKNDPAILYDIHNETHDIDFNSWFNRASEIIEAIQSVHPKALILVSGMNWAKTMNEFANKPLPYNNIVYSIHVYPWFGNENDWEQNFGQFTNRFPIFIGELGGGENDLTWGRSLLTYLNKKKLGWTAWSWVDQPHLTDQSDHRTATVFGQLVKDMLLRLSNPQQFAFTIDDLRIANLTSSSATVQWSTEEKSDSKVFYGLTSNYTDTLHFSPLIKTHAVNLNNLLESTTYHFKVSSEDEFGVSVQSNDSTFSTP